MKTAEATSSNVVRIKEFADRMQISIWTARQWAYRGKISSCKAGKHLLVPSSEIVRLVAENMRPHHTEETRVAA
jgi:predicted site-specific integrase-resolvase